MPLKEKTKKGYSKKGFEVRPEVHRSLKSTAVNREVPLWQALEEAITAWVERKDFVAPKYPYSLDTKRFHDTLDDVMRSDDKANKAYVEQTLNMVSSKLPGHRKPAPRDVAGFSLIDRLSEEDRILVSKFTMMVLTDPGHDALTHIRRALLNFKPKDLPPNEHEAPKTTIKSPVNKRTA